MELKDFVAETLAQICEGILEAKKRTSKTGARIAPIINAEGMVTLEGDLSEKAQLVHFELDVAEQQTEDKAKGIKVVLANFVSGKAESNTSSQNQHAHHVSFDVPVVWPGSGTKPYTPGM